MMWNYAAAAAGAVRDERKENLDSRREWEEESWAKKVKRIRIAAATMGLMRIF